jgi:phenylacetate-CoA ligase
MRYEAIMQKNINKEYPEAKLIRQFSEKNGAYWEKIGQTRALALFHDAAVRVPAYKDFLKKNNINHVTIKTWKDFQTVPLTNKKDYLKKYPLEQLCWDGNLNKPLVFTATSGSTGEPFYFPRTERLDWQMSVLVEAFLGNNDRKMEEPTLVMICFGMGIWIGGLITYKAFEIGANRNKYPISIITPGINKDEIFRALKKLSPQYKQTIFVGYPPFVKDIVDECPAQGIDLKKINMRFVFAAEAFSEAFREYLMERTGVKNMYTDFMHIYGSADIGAMACETATTVIAKRVALKNRKLFIELFSDIVKSPTVAQFNPLDIMFEGVNGEVVLTGNNALPLIRYAIGDNGGVLSYDEVEKAMKENGTSMEKEARVAKVKELYELPMVYLYERSDLSTKLYGAIIYPEHIREGMYHPDVTDYITGKFTMFTQFDEEHNEFLEIHFELKPDIKPSERLKKLVEELAVQSLIEKNAEYRNNYGSIPHRVRPRIVFWEYEHPIHFKKGIKQKWVKKI